MDKILPVPVADDSAIAVITSLAATIWEEHFVPIIGRAQVEYMLNKFQSKEAVEHQIRSGFLYYIARDSQGKDVGYYALLPRENDMFLSKIYLLRECRGRGYGRQIMNYIEKSAREKGVTSISLAVNKNNRHSIQAYGKMGFAISGAVIKDIGNGFVMDDYTMEKDIIITYGCPKECQMSKLIDNKDELDDILNEEKKVLIMFYADWCPYSQQFLPVFEKHARSEELKCYRVLIDDVEGCEDKYSISVVPTVLFFVNGEVVRRLDGAPARGLDEKQLRAMIRACGLPRGRQSVGKR